MKDDCECEFCEAERRGHGFWSWPDSPSPWRRLTFCCVAVACGTALGLVLAIL